MRKRTYISLFSSAGVGCYGFKQSGFECIATCELLPRRLKVQRVNHKCKYQSGYIEGDISLPENKNKIFEEIQLWKNKEKIKDVDVIIATPPCQGMSVANHKKKNELGRNSLIVQSINLVYEIRPKYFIFENVRAFLNTICSNGEGTECKIGEKIRQSLGAAYNIKAEVINFKDYGANSSRTRTLVIGTRKDLLDITPLDIFPCREKEKTLKEIIGNMPVLHNMGEISESDIYHFFRNYDKRMLPWIEHTKEGHSAFENELPEHRPHIVIKGQMIPNANKNGDKYRRCEWDKPMPCIHTRNDILASQSTIHPSENRVFSIRELMSLMNMPSSFKWSDISEETLNSMPLKDKVAFLKKEEINIRQSIGEAVPTVIFSKIAENIINAEKKSMTARQTADIIKTKELGTKENLFNFVHENPFGLNEDSMSKIMEFANARRTENAAFYTPKGVAFDVVSRLPEFKSDTVHILEPSAGAGGFIPFLCERYRDKKVLLDVIDIDPDSIAMLKELVAKRKLPNLDIRYFCTDFLKFSPDFFYDIVIGNPPFGKVNDKKLVAEYRKDSRNKNTSNIFAFFIEKCQHIGLYTALITPKSILSAPEFDATRQFLEAEADIDKIIDFGEKAFPGVKIETVALMFSSSFRKKPRDMQVISYITGKIYQQRQEDVFDRRLGFWVIYTDDKFRAMESSMELGVFSYFRDRTITKKDTCGKGRYRVLKSRNIGDRQVIDIPGYDSYIDDISSLQVRKFLDAKAILVPNLTYSPRACFLLPGMIADGSVAILQPHDNITISESDLSFFSSEEFRDFYMVGRNLGTRSLNIDKNSVKLWGIRRN